MTTHNLPNPAIRPARDSDIGELSRLRLEALQTEPTAFSRDYEADSRSSPAQWKAWFQERCDGENGLIFVAHARDRLAGMAGVARERTPKLRHSGFIWGVYVRPNYRRQNIGGRLSEACLQWAQEQGMAIVRLEVNSVNVAAIRLYAACGFRVCGLSPRALHVDGMEYDELMMVREIPTT